MDYIEGEPLDIARPERAQETGDARSRTRALIEMFIKVCDAVHAAHLRGVIHRDLKPSNIRVDRADGPHVLDFGLAKSVDAERDRP